MICPFQSPHDLRKVYHWGNRIPQPAQHCDDIPPCRLSISDTQSTEYYSLGDTSIRPQNIKILKTNIRLSFGRKSLRLNAQILLHRCHEEYKRLLQQTVIKQSIEVFVYRGFMGTRGSVDIAYLNAPLKETIFLEIPAPFIEKVGSRYVQLKKALYRLKQSGNAW